MIILKLGLRSNEGLAPLLEVVIALSLSAIIIGATAAVTGSPTNNAKVFQAEATLRIFQSDFESMINEVGLFIEQDPDNPENTTDLSDKYQQYLDLFKKNYGHLTFNVSEIYDQSSFDALTEEEKAEKEYSILLVKSDGFIVYTNDLDPWGIPYQLIYKETSDIGRCFCFTSAGKNSRFETNYLTSLSIDQFKKYDDISGILKIKNPDIDKGIDIG